MTNPLPPYEPSAEQPKRGHDWFISAEIGADTYCRRCGIGPDGIPGMATLPGCIATLLAAPQPDDPAQAGEQS